MRDIEPAELGRWYDAHAAALLLYARQWLERQAAEDVVQNAFLRLATHSDRVKNVRAWLFTAVRNAAMTEHRSRQRRDRRHRVVLERQADLFEPDVDDQIDGVDAQRIVDTLPPDQREIIVLRIWGGLSLPEAAEVLAEPVSTLFSRYKAGLAQIRRQMESPCKAK